MSSITNHVRSLLLFCSVLFILSGNLNAMEVDNQVGKIPVNFRLQGIHHLGPNQVLVYGENERACLDIYDYSGVSQTSYKIEPSIEEVFPIGDQLIMVLHRGNLDTLNLQTERWDTKFALPSRFDNFRDWYAMLDNNRIIIGYTDNLIKICNADTGATLKEFNLNCTGVANKTTDGHNRIFAVTFDQDLLVFGIEEASCVDTIKIPKRYNYENGKDFYVQSICYLDTNDIVLAWDDGFVSIWNLETKEKIQEFQAHKEWISSMISIGNGYFITGGRDGFVRTWRRSSDQCQHVFAGHCNDGPDGFDCQISALAFFGGGLIASGTDTNVQISRALAVRDFECGK